MKYCARDGSRQITSEESSLVTWRFIGVTCHAADYKSYAQIFKTTWQDAISGDESCAKAGIVPTPEAQIRRTVYSSAKRVYNSECSPNWSPLNASMCVQSINIYETNVSS
jgi:hypothetical protein